MINNLLLNKSFNTKAVSSRGEKVLKDVILGNSDNATLYRNSNGYLYTKDLYFIPTIIENYEKAGKPSIFVYKGWRYTQDVIAELVSAYNNTLEALTQLRNSGLNNIIEILSFTDEKIEIVRKIAGHYELQHITTDGLTTIDNNVNFEYQVKKEKKTLKAL